METLTKVPPFSIYIYIRAEQKYLLFARRGEELDAEKKERLKNFDVSHLHVRVDSKDDAEVKSDDQDALVNPYEGEILGEKASIFLQKSFRALMATPQADEALLSERLSKLAEVILSIVAPEVSGAKLNVSGLIKNIKFMNHSAAMTTLSVLCAAANDFTSKTSFKNLCYSVLLMDASLGTLEDKHLEAYYRDRKLLPTHVMERILVHPVKSQQLVANFPMVNETIQSLILSHHELHNGKGYHRGVKVGEFLPLARILSLAVDVYERLRAVEVLRPDVSLEEILMSMREPGLEPHLRRHYTPVLDAVLRYLEISVKKK